VPTRVQFAASDGPSSGNARASGTQAAEAGRLEWFLQGTQQPMFAIQHIAASAYTKRATGLKSIILPNQPAARITAPANGTILALDPDIPPKRQRLRLQAEGQNLRWLIDGKPYASGPSALWLPWPGRHHVQLADVTGRVLDEIRLAVRGAGVKQTRSPPK